MKNDFRVPSAGETNGAYCAHTSTRTEPAPAGSRHHAALKCAACGAFLRWLPRPANVEHRKLNGFKLAKLQMNPGLNPWERQFASSLARQGNKFTPKQQAVFDDLCATYLKGGDAR
jgi:hypothetical protein